MTKKFFSVLASAAFILVLVPAVYAQENESEPRIYGGMLAGSVPSTAAVSILYESPDEASRMTWSAELGLDTALVAARGLYRFSSRATSDGLTFQPYAGGGLVSLYGAANGLGVIGSGGVFISTNKSPRWRFSGEVNWVASNVNIVSVDGLGVRFGAHYQF